MWWTLLAATLASGTAVWIAYWVYPWQKKLDRQNDLLKERIVAYREYVYASLDIYYAQPFEGDTNPSDAYLSISDKEVAFYKAAQRIYMVGSDEVVSLASSHLNETKSFIVTVSNSMRGDSPVSKSEVRSMSESCHASREALINRMRLDTIADTKVDPLLNFKFRDQVRFFKEK